ncbi:MAG: glycosyltransferase, partial [Desulfovibrionaceae bacterium]|nr:glycosyltransferase [Desulfovibrionaceae bacterium]
ILDTSSGCAMSMRELMIHLKKRGWDVFILSLTIFDTETGTLRLRECWSKLQEKIGSPVNIIDGEITHHLIPTRSIKRFELTTLEEDTFFSYYIHALDNFKPDLVFYFGGHLLDFALADEANDRHVPVVAYLANAQYQDTRWCRDVDLLLTNSKAASDMYFERQGFRAIPIGVTINPDLVLAPTKTRRNVLFVNPSPTKGVAIVVVCALMLEKKRPDIIFEVVESRGNWQQMLATISKALGEERTSLTNVMVTANTPDMRPVYSRARLTLMPSMWYENFGRVAAESMMNGIPAVVSNRGGLPEVIQNGGITLDLPPECYKEPYDQVVRPQFLKPLTDFIERCYDDEAFYQSYVQKATQVGSLYTPEATTDRFIRAVAPLLARRAGDRDVKAPKARKNKQLPPLNL